MEATQELIEKSQKLPEKAKKLLPNTTNETYTYI